MTRTVVSFCLEFLSHSNIFHFFGDVTIFGEGLQNLTSVRHSWSFSSEGSLACHAYCDTGHPFIMVISDLGPVTLTPIAERLAVELSLPVLTTQVCFDRKSNPDLPHTRRKIYLPRSHDRTDLKAYIKIECEWIQLSMIISHDQFCFQHTKHCMKTF